MMYNSPMGSDTFNGGSSAMPGMPGGAGMPGGSGSFAPVQSWKRRLQQAFAKGGNAVESVLPGENPAEAYPAPGGFGQGSYGSPEGLPFKPYGPGGMSDTMPTGGDAFGGLQTPMPPIMQPGMGGDMGTPEAFGPSGFGAPPGFGSPMPQSPFGMPPGMGMGAPNPIQMRRQMWGQ